MTLWIQLYLLFPVPDTLAICSSPEYIIQKIEWYSFFSTLFHIHTDLQGFCCISTYYSLQINSFGNEEIQTFVWK